MTHRSPRCSVGESLLPLTILLLLPCSGAAFAQCADDGDPTDPLDIGDFRAPAGRW